MPYARDDRQDSLISIHLHGWLSAVALDQVGEDLAQAAAAVLGPHALVLDCTGLRVPELAQVRELVARLSERHADGLRAVAFVLPTPMLRGTMRAVLQTQAIAIDAIIVESLADGRRWARARLAEPEA